MRCPPPLQSVNRAVAACLLSSIANPDESTAMRLPKPLLIALIVALPLALLLVAFTGWYAWRVSTEIGSRPWRTPTEIVDRDGNTILEMYGADWRTADPVLLGELPERVPLAFLAAEDVRFRRHFGIDPIGVLRAMVTNVRAGGIRQGGSTITQQLAKATFFSADRTLRRKAAEAITAVLIELRLPKDDILEAYLNNVYLGHHDGSPVLGIDEASRLYFDRSPEDLTLAQAALLAGMVRAPNRDTAEKRPEVAKRRRDAILATMHGEGWITDEELDEAVDAPVRFRTGSFRGPRLGYSLAALRRELVDRVGERRLRGGGLIVETTLDLDMQKAAESAVSDGADRLRRRYRWLRRGEEPLQAALLSLDPATGAVRALVGGTDWKTSQFDRTSAMRRQAGSALKPFTYAAAIAGGEITPATIVEDEPIEIRLSRKDVWEPHNYDDRFRGDVTVREAFEKSLNIPAVRVAEDIGVGRVKRLLKSARVGGDFSDTPAIALGVDEVSMRDLVAAYSVFPNLGRRVEPYLIEKVETRDGDSVYRAKTRSRKVIDREVAWIVHSLMRGVVRSGTASSLSRQGLGHVAGKTGTTNDYRDAWFVGYAPDLVTGVWVGFDAGRPLRISSAEAALPLWAAFMKQVPHEKGEIEAPDGVEVVAVEKSSGRLWRSGCGEAIDEAFLEGTEPEKRCRPRPRPRRVPVYREPPVITVEQLREWVEEAPEELGEIEVEEESLEDAPPDEEPGEIIIEVPPLPEPDEERSPLPLPPLEEPPPPAGAKEERKGERKEEKRERKEEKRKEREGGRGEQPSGESLRNER